MKYLKIIMATFALIGFSTAHANLIAEYDVSSTSVENCSNAPHGLWTNRAFSGSCANFFDISGSFKQFSDGTATLNATAINPAGLMAVIRLSLSAFNATTPIDGYKQEGGLAFDPVNVDFYNAIKGTIEISSVTYEISFFRHSFQFGLGANAKSKTEYGGSAWICPVADCVGSQHWDLNLKFTESITTTNVNEPTGIIALGLALVLLGRRRFAKSIR